MTDSSAAAIRHIIAAMGDDPDRPGLRDTPVRVQRSWATLFGGYGMDASALLQRSFPCEGHRYSGMVALGDIDFFSTCEHHMLPFWGRAYVGYIPAPGGRIVGISKLARVVECYTRRLQVQERITDQIADAIDANLSPIGVGVVLRAQHLCITARGVQKQHAMMVTSAIRGAMQRHEVRAEFLSLVGLG